MLNEIGKCYLCQSKWKPHLRYVAMSPQILNQNVHTKIGISQTKEIIRGILSIEMWTKTLHVQPQFKHEHCINQMQKLVLQVNQKKKPEYYV